MAKLFKTVSVLILLLCFSLISSYAQTDAGSTVVGIVDGDEITYNELLREYKNGTLNEPNLEELESFLPLYIDFKLKIQAAKDQGYYKDEALLAEHRNYTTQAAYSFWLDKEAKATVFNRYKERASIELKTFHILITVPKKPTEQKVTDTIALLNSAKEEIKNGVPIEEVNAKYSSNRNGRSMGGDIPWITSGVTVKEFEDVIINMEKGEISEPFRTQFGYHVVLLQDKRPRTPARLVNHIFVRAQVDSVAQVKIKQAYMDLESGKEWSEVVAKYSEDKASVPNNGRIGWVSYGSNFGSDFVDPIINIDPALPYSEPFLSNYGYHIVKVDSIETYASEDERNAALLKEFEKSSYFQKNNSFVIRYLKNKFNAEAMESAAEAYKNWVISKDSINLASLDISKSLAEMQAYRFNNVSYTLSDYHKYIQANHGNILTNNYRDNWFILFQNKVIDDQMIDLTIQEYPEFKKQSQSFMDGLAVYKLNEDNIWSKATVDTTSLRTIYNNSPGTYQYSERPYYYFLTAAADSTLNKARSFILNGGDLDSLDSKFSKLLVNADSTQHTDEPYTMLSDMEVQSFSDIFEYNSLKGLFWLQDRLPARKMTFEEAFDQIHSRFQPQREKIWMESLRSSYNVEVYPNKLRKAYTQES